MIIYKKTYLLAAMFILACVNIYSQPFQKADSLFFAKDWTNASALYKKLLRDTSTNSLEWNRLGFSYYNLGKYDEALMSYEKAAQNNPPPALQPFLYSRMARVYASKNNANKLAEYLEKAITAGYFNFDELDTLKEYAAFQKDEKFMALRNKAYGISYPCSADEKARVFDFWVGDWDAYPTGNSLIVGHSIIEVVSGGCMILENWTSIGAPYSGKSMNFIDPSTGTWQQVWVGSDGSGQHVFVNGEYRDSAMRFDFDQPDAKGNKLKGRFSFFNEGANQFRQVNETSADDGKTWTTVYDFTYVRRKKG